MVGRGTCADGQLLGIAFAAEFRIGALVGAREAGLFRDAADRRGAKESRLAIPVPAPKVAAFTGLGDAAAFDIGRAHGTGFGKGRDGVLATLFFFPAHELLRTATSCVTYRRESEGEEGGQKSDSSKRFHGMELAPDRLDFKEKPSKKSKKSPRNYPKIDSKYRDDWIGLHRAGLESGLLGSARFRAPLGRRRSRSRLKPLSRLAIPVSSPAALRFC